MPPINSYRQCEAQTLMQKGRISITSDFQVLSPPRVPCLCIIPLPSEPLVSVHQAVKLLTVVLPTTINQRL